MKKYEKVILFCAAAVILFVLGFWLGGMMSSGDIKISVETAYDGQASAGLSIPTPTPSSEAPSQLRININTATVEELMALDGIGEVLAGRIVAYREKYGAFSSPSDIMNVEGIAEKKYDAIKDNITAE